jgi:hypothetical protein
MFDRSLRFFSQAAIAAMKIGTISTMNNCSWFHFKPGSRPPPYAPNRTTPVIRNGGANEDHSGDIFIAFATGNQHVSPAAYESKRAPTTGNLSMVSSDKNSELFLAATEAVEDAIPMVILPRRQESLDKLVYLSNISSP